MTKKIEKFPSMQRFYNSAYHSGKFASFGESIMTWVYVRSIMRSTMYQKAQFR